MRGVLPCLGVALESCWRPRAFGWDDPDIANTGCVSQTTKGGIVLPEAAQKAPNEGVVVAVGPGARDTQGQLIVPGLAEGDAVLLPEFGGTKVTVADEVRRGRIDTRVCVYVCILRDLLPLACV